MPVGVKVIVTKASVNKFWVSNVTFLNSRFLFIAAMSICFLNMLLFLSREPLNEYPFILDYLVFVVQGGSYLQSGVKNVFDVDTDDSNDSHKCDSYGAKDVNGSGNECVAQSDTSPVVEFFNSANDGRDNIFEGNFGVEDTVHGLSRMEPFGRRGFNFALPATNEKECGCSHLELESCVINLHPFLCKVGFVCFSTSNLQ